MLRQKNNAKTISDYENVRTKLNVLADYMEASKHAGDCTNEINKLQLEQQQREEAERAAREKEARRIAKKKKIITISAVSVIAVAIAVVLVITQLIIPNNKYNEALALKDEGKYQEAITAFKAVNGYKDSSDKIKECETVIKDKAYDEALALLDNQKYQEAITAFKAIDGYKDSAEKIKECEVGIKKNVIKNSSVGDIVEFGNYNGNTEWIVLERENNKVLIISKDAIEIRKYNQEYTPVTWETCTL